MNEAKATTTDSIISRLRCGSKHSILNVADEAVSEIERLRKERDEARRRNCELLHEEGYGRSPEEWAERKGWDCFKDNP